MFKKIIIQILSKILTKKDVLSLSQGLEIIDVIQDIIIDDFTTQQTTEKKCIAITAKVFKMKSPDKQGDIEIHVGVRRVVMEDNDYADLLNIF